MRYGKLTVYLLTLLFAAAAVFLWVMEPQTEVMPVCVILNSRGEEKAITCWENEAGDYYLFLPGFADLDTARLQLHANELKIDGKTMEDGMTCEPFSLGTPYSFSYAAKDGEVCSEITFVQSGGLPALFIDSGSGNMEYIHGKKGNQESGRISLFTPEGEPAYIGNLDKIQGRGNDWLIEKKSYSLQLSTGADLLGMGQAEKWILTSNAFDPSHLRNKLIYDFSGAVGLDFSPESRWVDLYLNGEYAGLYLLSERNELHRQRISLEGNEQYLVSMDVQWRLEQNARPFVKTQAGYPFRIHSSQLSDSNLQQLLQNVENAISAEDGRDPLTGKHWTELIDLDSWVKKYLVEEIFANSDGGAISQYYYGNGVTGPVHAGPVWDYDISMGNALSWRVTEPRTIIAGRQHIRSSIPLSWYYELCRQEVFRDRMTELYETVFLPLLDIFLTQRLEEYTDLLEAPSAMNQIRWQVTESAASEAQKIHSFMTERIAFFNQLWLDREPFLFVLVNANDGSDMVCFALRPGESLTALPEYEPSEEIQGWYTVDSGEPFDPAQPIYESTEIALRRDSPTGPGEEEEEESIFFLIQYAPAAVLLGILGLFCIIDRTPARREATKISRRYCQLRKDRKNRKDVQKDAREQSLKIPP